MVDENPDTTKAPIPDDPGASPPGSTDPALSPSSSSRLNARAPEYVPRTDHHGRGGRHQGHHHHPHHHHHHYHHQQQQHHQQRVPARIMQIHHHGPPPPPPHAIQMFPHHGPGFHAPPHPAAVHGHHVYGGGGGGGGGAGFVEFEGAGPGSNEYDGGSVPGAGDSDDHVGVGVAPIGGLSEDVVQKVTKQVEYYLSDINLATTEHLMRFISKDPEGFVPVSVIASFKKIKALVNNNAQLATALRTSRKLVVSDDGKKVRRQQSITDSDLEELQSRIVVAENLPDDHCYQNLVKVFSVVGSVKNIRTCYPQSLNGAVPVNPRPGKIDTYLFNRLHAFVEYDTLEQAERAVEELNNEGSWRSGLRVRLLSSCMKHGQNRGKKAGHEGDGNFEEEDHPQEADERHSEDYYLPVDVSQEEMGEEGCHDKEGVAKRGRGRGRGGRGRGRGQHQNNNRIGSHPNTIGVPPGHSTQTELSAATKPPGPRMPDGTRGFTMGRGKPAESTGTTS